MLQESQDDLPKNLKESPETVRESPRISESIPPPRIRQESPENPYESLRIPKNP